MSLKRTEWYQSITRNGQDSQYASQATTCLLSIRLSASGSVLQQVYMTILQMPALTSFEPKASAHYPSGSMTTYFFTYEGNSWTTTTSNANLKQPRSRRTEVSSQMGVANGTTVPHNQTDHRRSLMKIHLSPSRTLPTTHHARQSTLNLRTTWRTLTRSQDHWASPGNCPRTNPSASTLLLLASHSTCLTEPSVSPTRNGSSTSKCHINGNPSRHTVYTRSRSYTANSCMLHWLFPAVGPTLPIWRGCWEFLAIALLCRAPHPTKHERTSLGGPTSSAHRSFQDQSPVCAQSTMFTPIWTLALATGSGSSSMDDGGLGICSLDVRRMDATSAGPKALGSSSSSE